MNTLDNALKQIDDRIVVLYRVHANTGKSVEDRINDWQVMICDNVLYYRGSCPDWQRTDRKSLREMLVKYTHRGEVWSDVVGRHSR